MTKQPYRHDRAMAYADELEDAPTPTRKQLQDEVKALKTALSPFLQLASDANPENNRVKLDLLSRCPEFQGYIVRAAKLLEE